MNGFCEKPNMRIREKNAMTVTVNLYYTGKNGSAAEFVREMISSGTVEKIRAEEGNLKYDYFVKMDDPETVLLIDSWQSQAALDAHHKSPMMKKIAELRDKYDLHMKVERYSSDEFGLPNGDARYIRK